jgi:predicted TIM-barrel fold metal-dependent hydrolase
MTTEPIVDAHHHIWRPADQPWLQGPTVPRIFGAYDSIKRDYLIEEYLEDANGQGVMKSVYVQTNWPKEDAVLEVEWVQETAGKAGSPHAIVGFADFDDDAVGETLAAQAKFPLMRGIRQQLHWHENPQYRFASRADLMNTADFRRNFDKLEEYGWLFELQVFSGQMPDAAAFVKAFPRTIFILTHAGMLENRSRDGVRQWREGMKRLADLPNMHSKLSGLGTFLRRNDPQHVADVIGETVEIFGADRCLWGSNFPIEKIWTDYASLVEAVRAAVAHLGEADRRAVMHDNAVRLYRL